MMYSAQNLFAPLPTREPRIDGIPYCCTVPYTRINVSISKSKLGGNDEVYRYSGGASLEYNHTSSSSSFKAPGVPPVSNHIGASMATDCRDQEDSVVVLAGLGMSSGLLYSYDYSKIGKDVLECRILCNFSP